jgi:hypothetical protein
MPEQLFLCSQLLDDVTHFTIANRPRVTGKLPPPASHKPPPAKSFDAANPHEVA